MEQVVDLADVEAEGREVAAEFRELAGLECQKLVVPVGPFGKLVVGENERPLSRRAEIGELNCRHLGQPQLPRRQPPAMPGDYAVLAVDEHRVGEAELADRAGDQRHLRLAVGAGIAGVGNERIDLPVLDAQPDTGEPTEIRSEWKRRCKTLPRAA
jgi:hypothetical protein